ncbi:MAG: HD domain-containing protein [Gammaproteobacteria bacterium]|jgi:guanosine-3',5'-bis(diphosphate) 3'-pyrophosphohydrolase
MTRAPEDLKRLLKALSFAALRHRDQRRKDVEASPYINHPIEVASILCREAGIHDIDLLCAALLHDTVEDTDTTAAELEAGFGARIAAIVVELSDDKSLPRQERERRQVEHAAHLSEAARLVKLADKISNLRNVAESPPPGWSLRRQQAYFDWGKRVIDRLRGVDRRLEALFDRAYAARPGDRKM